MKRNRKLALPLALGAALLTLSGCDGTQDGTLDYIDGHWVYTDAQTEQSTDVTQLLDNPDAFYAAASAMGDDELRSCFDRLTSGQCAELFRSLGEERAIALAGRLTQPQVERLLTALQGQERVQSLTDPAALAAVWPTLTTDEQLMALSVLSSEDYAALWALLDGATPSPVPDAPLPEATDAPDMTDPVYLEGIWHELSQQEQSGILGGLSSAQFVALRSLLDAQGSAASGEATPAPSDGGTDAQQTLELQTSAPQTPEESSEIPAESVHDSEGASAQESDASPSSSPDTEQAHIALPTDPAALAEVWFTLSPQEQMSAMPR